MKPIILRFAEFYSAEFMKRLSIGRLNGTLTPEELERANNLWLTSDSMASVELINLQDMTMAMHVASLDTETGYFDERIIQNLTLCLHEKIREIVELQYIASEALATIKDHELDQLKVRVL